MPDQFKVEWFDHEREPQCPPNPAYPEGIDLRTADGAANHCTVPLPYPAKRCGVYLVECGRCGLRVACTTAGRPDDPRSIELRCFGNRL